MGNCTCGMIRVCLWSPDKIDQISANYVVATSLYLELLVVSVLPAKQLVDLFTCRLGHGAQKVSAATTNMLCLTDSIRDTETWSIQADVTTICSDLKLKSSRIMIWNTCKLNAQKNNKCYNKRWRKQNLCICLLGVSEPVIRFSENWTDLVCLTAYFAL